MGSSDFRDTAIMKRWRRIREEVLQHKWYESERVGQDVGWDYAYTDWLLKHGHEFDIEHPPSEDL